MSKIVNVSGVKIHHLVNGLSNFVGHAHNMEEHDAILGQNPCPHGGSILYEIWDRDEKKWVCTGILQAQQILTNG